MDIDIDIPETCDREKIFPKAVRASMVKDGKLITHPCGMFMQNMPRDPVTGLSAIPYSEAADLGFTKIDLLHLTILNRFPDKEYINRLLKKEPKWSLLTDPDIVPQLFQLGNHYDVLFLVRPKNILELADCIALIRPGKRELLDDYINAVDRTGVRKRLYSITAKDKYAYKKGHAIAYAMVIVLQLHILGYTDVIE